MGSLSAGFLLRVFRVWVVQVLGLEVADSLGCEDGRAFGDVHEIVVWVA